MTAEQKEKLTRINQEHQQKLWDLQKQAFERASSCSAPRRKKLEEMTEPGYRWAMPGAAVEVEKK